MARISKWKYQEPMIMPIKVTRKQAVRTWFWEQIALKYYCAVKLLSNTKLRTKCINERQAMADGRDAHVQSASKNGVNPILTCHKVQPNKPQGWETYHLGGNNRHRKTDFNGTGLKGFQHFEIYAENINGRTEHRQRCNWTDTKDTANVKFQSVQQCHYRQTAQQIGCYKETP